MKTNTTYTTNCINICTSIKENFKLNLNKSIFFLNTSLYKFQSSLNLNIDGYNNGIENTGKLFVLILEQLL